MGRDVVTCPKDCTIPEDEHRCFARAIAGHQCWGGDSHQHFPKRSQGGKNIVAILDLGLHDAIDNGFRYQGRRWQNDVENGRYRIFDRDSGEILLSREVSQ